MTHVTPHESLLGKSDLYLRLCSATATHQHFKGGLYKVHGPAFDTDTGKTDKMSYRHMYPHGRIEYIRDLDEFNGLVDTPEGHPAYGLKAKIKRFRKFGEEW